MSIDWQDTVKHLNDLGETDVEIRDDTEGHYLSIPTGADSTAIEVEEEVTTKTMPSGRVTSSTMAHVIFRRWDRTHGLDDEVLLATVHQIAPPMLAAVIHGLLAEYQRQYDSLDREMQDAFAGEEEQQRLADMRADEWAGRQ